MLSLGRLYIFIYFKTILTVRSSRKWSRDAELDIRIHASPFIALSFHWEAAAQAGTTFSSTPFIQVAM